MVERGANGVATREEHDEPTSDTAVEWDGFCGFVVLIVVAVVAWIAYKLIWA